MMFLTYYGCMVFLLRLNDLLLRLYDVSILRINDVFITAV